MPELPLDDSHVSTAQADAKAHAHHLLVCLDRSSGAESVLPHVLGIAKTFQSDVTLLHVMERSRGDHDHSPMSDVLGWEIARREAEIYLERIQRQTARALGRPVGIQLEQGEPAERIADVAREIGADLIVLSRHGGGSTTGSHLGSTAQHVLALAPGSVFIVHSFAADPDGLPKRLLVPLDGSLRAESVLPTAARVSRAYDAELLLVHVVLEPLPTLVLHAPEDRALAHQLALQLEAAGNRYLEQLRDRLTHEHPRVRTHVMRHSNERQALLEVSERERADLIVLSAHGSACDPMHSYGSVTTDLLTHSQLPLLVLQDLGQQDSPRPRDFHPNHAPPLRASFAPEAE